MEDFVELAHSCQQRGYMPVLLGAGENTKDYGEEFVAACPDSINLIGKCSLRQTYAVLKRCELFVGGDTGPMHMATASGIKGCGLYFTHWRPEGIDTPERFGPWGENIKVLQPRDKTTGTDNIGRIDPCEVEDAILWMIGS